MKRLSVVVGAVVLAACSSHGPTAPASPPLIVTLSGPSSIKGQPETTEGGGQVYACNYTLTVTASGGIAGEAATWTGGGFSLQFPNGDVDTALFSGPAEFDNGDATITAGTQLSWTEAPVSAGPPPSPYQLSLVLYYSTPRASNDSATYSFACN